MQQIETEERICMPEKMNLLGVIGGMGIDTSHKFVKNLVTEYPNILVRYVLAKQHGLDPAKEPGYIQEGLFKEDFEEVVVRSALQLAKDGATHIVLVCNTAHQHEPAIKLALEPFNSIFLSIIEAVATEVRVNNLSRVLLMATSSTTFGVGLYDSIPNIVKPSFEDQQVIDTVILKILRQEVTFEDVRALVEMALKHGTDGFLFACTDLAMVMDQFKEHLSTFNDAGVVIESTQALKTLVASQLGQEWDHFSLLRHIVKNYMKNRSKTVAGLVGGSWNNLNHDCYNLPMSNKEIERGFTTGLLAGYAGKSEFTKAQRSTFPIKMSHVEAGGLIYDDQWLDAHTGGGQELLAIGDQKYTRLYAGGVISAKELEALGIKEEQVITFLIETIQELKTATRLFSDCPPITKNNWEYSYTVTDREPTINLTTAKEIITFKGQVVFVHTFMLCKVSWKCSSCIKVPPNHQNLSTIDQYIPLRVFP